jgi:integrase
MEAMPRKLPLYVTKETSRHGKTVFYFRKGKGERTRLPDINDPKFKAAYKAAFAGIPLDEEEEVSPPKSIRWLVERYMRSAKWAGFSVATRKQQSLFFKQLTERAGNAPFKHVSTKDIRRALDERKDTPFLANNYLKALRGLFGWALENVDGCTFDPTMGVTRLKTKSEGFPMWTADDVQKFRARWEIGTLPRLAMELMLLSGLRRSDIRRAGRQHMSGKVLTMTTEKTGAEITVEFSDYLMDIVNRTKTGDLLFIPSSLGAPYTKESFGNWFGDQCRAAKLAKRKNSHGLRKLAATMAANGGATSNGLTAQFGWSNTQQADVYTKKADRARLGITTSRIVAEQIENMQAPHLNAGEGVSEENAGKSKAK